MSEKLPELGMVKKQERIEYKSPLANLPGNEENPIQWLNMQEADWGLPRIAEFLKKVAIDDPDYDQNDDPLVFIEDWLKDPVLNSGLQCIEIGFVKNQAMALVVAQVNPRTKWSRISYMGISPEYRGKGLGKWVHRQGFAMMRVQGGELYHGGTHSENLAMRRLFEKHGCAEFRQMEEWTYKFERDSI